MSILTNLELAILGLIAEKPKHGYQIERDIQARGMREWAQIGFSSIYHALNKLEQQGDLTSALDTTGQGPARKVYSLSRQGMQRLKDAISTRLATPRRYSSDLDLALAFSGILQADEILRCLKEYSTQLSGKIQALNEKRSQDRIGGLPEAAEWLFDHSLRSLDCELEWVQKILTNIPAR